MFLRVVIPIGVFSVLAGGVAFFTRSTAVDPGHPPAFNPAAPPSGKDAPASAKQPLDQNAIPEETSDGEPVDPEPRPLRPEDVLEFEVGPDGGLRPRGPV
jgi:hypothetical protein